jgi:hypothetical protein
MKIGFSLKNFAKSSNIKLHENPFIGSRTDRKRDGRTYGQTDRQTDRHDEANSRVRIFEKAPKILKSRRNISVAQVAVLEGHSTQANIKRID